MPIPTAIPAAVRLSGSIGTRLAERTAARAGAAPVAKSLPRFGTSVCRQTGTTRVVTPKKIPSHLSTPNGGIRPSSLPIKPFQSRLPNTQQMQNFCKSIYNKADELGLVDLALELAADHLKNTINQHRVASPNIESTNSSTTMGETSPAVSSSGNDTISRPPQQADFSSSMAYSSASVINQIRDLLGKYQAEMEQSPDFSEPTVDLDESGLRR